MRAIVALLLISMLAGCTGRGQKDENKDKDRPKPAVTK